MFCSSKIWEFLLPLLSLNHKGQIFANNLSWFIYGNHQDTFLYTLNLLAPSPIVETSNPAIFSPVTSSK